MPQKLEQPIPNQLSQPNPYHETVIVSAGAPIVLSVWPGDPGAPTVVFLPGTMTHPLFYADFLDGLNQRGLSVVGVHYQGHGKSPRSGSRLGWANLVVNATDAVGWAADHLDGPVVLLGSSQGGVLAMAVAARNRQLALVAAHNVLDPSLPESLMISRLPGWLVGGYRPLLAALRLAARIAPGLPVPLWAYLDLDRTCGQPETRRRFLIDPLGLRCYPLGFLAELCTTDLSGMCDGSIGCPVLVIAATGDPLFSFGYTRRVFDRIVAPAKELLVFDVDRHLLFNECVQLVTDPLVDRIHRLAVMPGTAQGGM
jgi:alpha-beta hydrolase superfamily lysophospholipase